MSKGVLVSKLLFYSYIYAYASIFCNVWGKKGFYSSVQIAMKLLILRSASIYL